jgi:hypothetical protein
MQSESLNVLRGMNKAHNRRWGKEVEAGIAQQDKWAGALIVEHATLQRAREASLDPTQLQAVHGREREEREWAREGRRWQQEAHEQQRAREREREHEQGQEQGQHRQVQGQEQGQRAQEQRNHHGTAHEHKQPPGALDASLSTAYSGDFESDAGTPARSMGHSMDRPSSIGRSMVSPSGPPSSRSQQMADSRQPADNRRWGGGVSGSVLMESVREEEL